MSNRITTLSDASFDEHVKTAETAVLVDFWADWCGPCKQIAPILDELAAEHPETLSVAKLNIDENLDVTRRFEVMSVPTLLLFKDGEVQARITGRAAKPSSCRRSRRTSERHPAARRAPAACGRHRAGGRRPAEPVGGHRPDRGPRRTRRVRRRHRGDRRGLPARTGSARRRGLRRPDLVGAGRGRVPPRRPLPLPPPADAARGRRGRPQRRLSALGFDTGRVDGIFGRQTASALGEFQRNAGLPVDGILGAETLRDLKRMMPRHAEPELVSAVRAGSGSARRRGPCSTARSPSVRRAASTPWWPRCVAVSRGGRPGRPPAASRRVDSGCGGQRRRGRGLSGPSPRPRTLALRHGVLFGVPVRVPRWTPAGGAGADAGRGRPRGAGPRSRRLVDPRSAGDPHAGGHL